MSIGRLGQNLVFLISQPRAGSTLLQRILGNLPDIHTISEPWLLLPPIYSNRKKGVWYEFDAHTAQIAHQNFVHALPNEEDDIDEAMRLMYVYLYNQALDGTGKSSFLDKTPRYYLIIPELHRLFPRSHFIILFRNPLAVLSSIQRTWVRKRWLLLHKRKMDLLEAPQLLLDGARELEDYCTVVHYENLINEPAVELERICSALGIEFSPDIIEYGSYDAPSWRHGDKAGIGQHAIPNPGNENKWEEDLLNPQVWRLARDYLKFLGRNTVKQMGYSHDEISQTLIDRKPNTMRLWFTYPSWLLLSALNFTENAGVLERRIDRVIELLGDAGVGATAKAVVQGLRTTDNQN